MGPPALLEVHNLTKTFSLRGGLLAPPQYLHAVDDVSFTLERGETLGLVGESGSGKSTIGQMIMRLLAPSSGRVLFEGRDIATLDREGAAAYARSVQIIFQDPYSSLNPQRTVEQILSRPLIIHGLAKGRRELRDRIVELLADAGLVPGEKYLDRYPHQMSGGERQRVAIARALSTRPRLIVADEAVSSLDVSIRAQLLNLLKDLQAKHGLSYLFITHDLPTLGHVSHRVAVMYLGKIMEIGTSDEVLGDPRHPYTRALLDAIPIADPQRARARTALELKGAMPSPVNPPSGCRFRTRCRFEQEVCGSAQPPVLVEGDRRIHCLPDVAGLARPSAGSERAGEAARAF